MHAASVSGYIFHFTKILKFLPRRLTNNHPAFPKLYFFDKTCAVNYHLPNI